MPFLSPNQQCQSTEGKNITFHGLAPSSTRVFQLCLWLLIAPGYLGEGCHASSHQPSDASTLAKFMQIGSGVSNMQAIKCSCHTFFTTLIIHFIMTKTHTILYIFGTSSWSHNDIATNAQNIQISTLSLASLTCSVIWLSIALCNTTCCSLRVIHRKPQFQKLQTSTESVQIWTHRNSGVTELWSGCQWSSLLPGHRIQTLYNSSITEMHSQMRAFCALKKSHTSSATSRLWDRP